MSEVSATPVTLKCKICGGDIINDYLVGSCVCAHCGNKWSLEELVPDYAEYSHAIMKINKANDLLAGDPAIENLEQARIFFQNASDECSSKTGPIASDLMKVCKDGRETIDRIKAYSKAKKAFDKKSYQQALKGFRNLQGFRDSDTLAQTCKVEIEKARKKQIPIAVIVGFILPAVVCIILKEFAGLPLPAVIPIFLLGSAGIGYLVYRGGAWSIVIKVLSFLSAVPLILFMILAYVFNLGAVPSGIIAVGLPIAMIIAFAVLAERKS